MSPPPQKKGKWGGGGGVGISHISVERMSEGGREGEGVEGKGGREGGKEGEREGRGERGKGRRKWSGWVNECACA